MKYLFLFLFVPIVTFAKYYEGNIKFTNGKTLTGFIEIPEMNDSKINFKTALNGKNENYTIDEVDQINLKANKNEIITFISSKYYVSSMSGKIKGVSDKKIWLQIFYDGKLKIYNGANSMQYSGMGQNHMNKTVTTISYYLKALNREYPQKVFEDYEGSAVIGLFKMQKKLIEIYFKDDCPILATLLTKEELNSKGYTLIGELYDQNCGK